MLALLMAAVVSVATILQPGAKPEAPTASSPASAKAPQATHLDWTIDGVKREAIVYAPADAAKSASPLIFAFHGHGGTAGHAARTFNYQKHWPEAIVVYMQGLPTPGMTDPEGKRDGWQKTVGDQGDRDLKFFDAVLTTIKRDYKVDDTRIYCTGHSNGGAFTYLLWAARGDVFAAVAPAAGGLREFTTLKPKPAMHIAGENDTTVPFAYQQRMMEHVRRIDGCEAKGTAWAEHCTLYESKAGTPFVSLIYPGTHAFPQEAPPLIVRFFKEHAKPAPEKPAPEKPAPEKPAPDKPEAKPEPENKLSEH